MKSRFLRFAALSVGMTAVFVACGGKDKAADSTKTATQAGDPNSFRIAMIAKSSTNPVFLSGRKGADDAAAEISKATGVQVSVDWLTPPNEDATIQAQRIAEA